MKIAQYFLPIASLCIITSVLRGIQEIPMEARDIGNNQYKNCKLLIKDSINIDKALIALKSNEQYKKKVIFDAKNIKTKGVKDKICDMFNILIFGIKPSNIDSLSFQPLFTVTTGFGLLFINLPIYLFLVYDKKYKYMFVQIVTDFSMGLLIWLLDSVFDERYTTCTDVGSHVLASIIFINMMSRCLGDVPEYMQHIIIGWYSLVLYALFNIVYISSQIHRLNDSILGIYTGIIGCLITNVVMSNIPKLNSQ